jgi:GT2 family glycosyltransferase
LLEQKEKEAKEQKAQTEAPGLAFGPGQEQAQQEGLIPIIIPVYGNLGYLAQCLEAIRQNTRLPYQLTLVDDCSPVGESVTVQWLEGVGASLGWDGPWTSSLTVIRHPQNRGYTQAVNTGIRYCLEARHRRPWQFLVLLNTDTQPQPGWLEAIRETVDNASNVGIVGAKLLSMDNPDQILHGGTMDLMGTHKGGSDRQGHCQKRTDEVWITGAVMAITYECLLHCGLLDHGWRHFCSDSGYCLEARLRGFRVIYQPKCRVLHKQSATVSRVVEGSQLQRDQQRLLDRVTGQIYRDLVAELPFGVSRNLQQR